MPCVVRIRNPTYEIRPQKDHDPLDRVQALYALFDMQEIIHYAEFVPPESPQKIWWKLVYLGSDQVYYLGIETNAVGFSLSGLDSYITSLCIWEGEMHFKVSVPVSYFDGQSNLPYPRKKKGSGPRICIEGKTIDINVTLSAPFVVEPK